MSECRVASFARFNTFEVPGSCSKARAGAARRMLLVAWRGTAEWRVLGRDDGSNGARRTLPEMELKQLTTAARRQKKQFNSI